MGKLSSLPVRSYISRTLSKQITTALYTLHLERVSNPPAVNTAEKEIAFFAHQLSK